MYYICICTYMSSYIQFCVAWDQYSSFRVLYSIMLMFAYFIYRRAQKSANKHVMRRKKNTLFL